MKRKRVERSEGDQNLVAARRGLIQVAPDMPGGRGAKFDGILQRHERVRVWLSSGSYLDVFETHGAMVVRSKPGGRRGEQVLLVTPIDGGAVYVTTPRAVDDYQHAEGEA